MLKKTFGIFFIALFFSSINAQNLDELPIADYSNPQEYIIDTVIVSGTQFLDSKVLASMSGFEKGSKITIPGDDITKTVKKYWEHGLFENVKITATKLGDNKISLNIELKERPRLSRLIIEGISKSDKDDINGKLELRPGSQVTENTINNAVNIIKKFYIEKGYFNTSVKVTQVQDSTQKNRMLVTMKIDKNQRVKIKEIYFTGNVAVPSKKLRRAMKKTKRRDWNIFNTSKYIEAQYKEDKGKIIDYYNDHGYRDAKILSDSIQIINPKRINLYINLFEGPKYYFRNIKWVGNTKFPTILLSSMLGIKKGDVFNQQIMDKRLQTDEDAVSSVYLDNGYLFFNVTPVETDIENDSIDFEMRIYEGRQATLNNILISGNTKTNEHVVRRELRTLPGELFSKSDIIRSVRELANLGHFEPEKIEPTPIPNPSNSTVDIEYKLVERANDQLEVSGGWGNGMFIGTIGVKFSNFSTHNFFDLKEWRPVPSGDGQTLSLRFQTNGSYYHSYNVSFMEPWFGGTKPNTFSVSAYHSKVTYGGTGTTLITQINSNQYYTMTGIAIGLGRRLTWPDDYFVLQNQLSYDISYFHDYTAVTYGINNGYVNNLNFGTTISRNSLDQLIYPRRGSNISLGLQLTPPYSLFNNKNYADPNMPASERYNWIEYHKWVFKADNYLSIVGNLVILTRAQFGILGLYNQNVGYPPFGGFDLGGDGMNYSAVYNIDVIGLRGYENESLTPRVDNNNNLITVTSNTGKLGGNVYDKFTAELRYPLTLKEQTAIYGLIFAEGGNAWNKAEAFDPFSIKRSLGVGIRVFLPMFGMLGVDWGYGFDQAQWPGANHGQFHFTLGQQN
jgi:outer membrane protein insertion porin family